jgi:excisionase family DNA binding protein
MRISAVTGYSCFGYRRYGEVAVARSSVLREATRVEPTSDDRDRAAEISRGGASLSQAVLRLPSGEEIVLPESLVTVLIASAGQLSQGHGVTVLATEVCLTPAEVGELLGLSRPFVVRLLDAGEIPSEHLPGSKHRLVRLVDVLEFQVRRERRRAGRRRIADAVQAADLPY